MGRITVPHILWKIKSVWNHQPAWDMTTSKQTQITWKGPCLPDHTHKWLVWDMQETCFLGLVDITPQWWQTTKPYYPPVIYAISHAWKIWALPIYRCLVPWEWCFSIAMLNWQRVNNPSIIGIPWYTQISSRDPAPIETGSVEACCFARYSSGHWGSRNHPGTLWCWGDVLLNKPSTNGSVCIM